MSDISNSYRKEIRELLIKRISAARQKFLDGHVDAIEKAKQAAEQVGTLVDKGKEQVGEYVERGRRLVGDQSNRVAAAVEAGREAYRTTESSRE